MIQLSVKRINEELHLGSIVKIHLKFIEQLYHQYKELLIINYFNRLMFNDFINLYYLPGLYCMVYISCLTMTDTLRLFNLILLDI